MIDSIDRKGNVDWSCLSIPLKMLDSIQYQNVLYKKFILYSTYLLTNNIEVKKPLMNEEELHKTSSSTIT